MRKLSKIGATLIGAAMLCAAPISLHQSQRGGLSLSVDDAYARVGRPMTPRSAAGVARRTHRRVVRRRVRRCVAGVCHYVYENVYVNY